jgi:hypothetical protein
MVPVAAPPGVPARRAPLLRRILTLRGASSPTRLRLASGVTVVCALALALGGSWSVSRRADSIDAAARAAQQLILVQDVRVHVVQADALASRAYLQRGQETTDQRALYDTEVAAATTGLVAAARAASDADLQLLRDAGSSFAQYVGLVEQARANNRQGFPVGAAYQRQARTVSQQVVDGLRSVEAHERGQVDDLIARAHRASWLLLLTTVVLVAVLLAGGTWLAMRFRRLVNVPLAIASLVAAAALVGGVALSSRAITRADQSVTGQLAEADLLAQARAAAFDARSNEALTLIARGSGDAYETAWLESASVVDQALDQACRISGVGCDLVAGFHQYTAAHEVVRTLDGTTGDWDSAVALSVSGTASAAPAGTPNPVTAFAAFADASASLVGARTTDAVDGLASATSGLGAVEALLVAAGIAVGALAMLGYARRLREYR